MAAPKITRFALEDLPSVTTQTPPKHSPEELDQYIAAIQDGAAASDGVGYPDSKAAKSAAASVKRGLKKYAPEISVAMRVFEHKGAWVFALRPFTPSTKDVDAE